MFYLDVFLCLAALTQLPYGICTFIEEEKKPIYLSGQVGETVVFICDLDFPQGVVTPYILYFYKEGERSVSVQDGSMEASPGLAGRAQVQTEANRANLSLSSLRETDHGWWECRLYFPNRTPPTRLNGTWYHLTVHGSELLSLPPTNQTVEEGSPVRLECGTRDPEARLTWYKDGNPLSALVPVTEAGTVDGGGPNTEPTGPRVDSGGNLVIDSAGVTDPGVYTCEVIAPNGRSQSASAYLDVRYRARVVYTAQEVFLPYGRPGVLDCHFSANPPLTKLRWEKDGFLFDPFNVPGVFYKRNGSLHFNKVEESHGGEYTCTPYNDLGTLGPSAPIRVLVQHPPTFTVTPRNMYLRRLGDSILLPCDALDGNSAHRPSIVWFKKDGSPLPDRASVVGGNLTISNIRESDRGFYQCVASNEAATISTDTELLIEGTAPRGPYNLTGNVTFNSATLSWRPGSSLPSDQYSIWVRATSSPEWRTVAVNGDRAIISSLDPGVEYEFMVLVQDHNGGGMFSRPLKLRTQGRPVETAVTASTLDGVTLPGIVIDRSESRNGLIVKVTAAEDGYLLEWKSHQEESTPADQQYQITWGEVNGPSVVLETTDTSYRLGSLEAGAIYQFRVSALTGNSSSESSSDLLLLHVPETRQAEAGTALALLAAAFTGAALSILLILGYNNRASLTKKLSNLQTNRS